jgi:hypothetical protein
MLATDHRQTLEFFLHRLKDVSGSGVEPEELLYNASVLAHYAQVSTHATFDVAAPPHLGAVFDDFVIDATLWRDGRMMETAGAQCLVLAGFFEDQMRRRHNIGWYSQLGASFFSRAALEESSPARARLLDALATQFEAWRRRHARLARDLRDQALLLTLPPAQS